MRSWCFWASFILTIAPVAAAGAADIDALDWLTGCWVGVSKDQHTEECWLHPAGGIMLGLSRTVSSEATGFEFFRIGPYEQGLAYFASPSGGPATPFRLVEVAPGRAVFSNPDHDFPQRLIYSLEGDTLRANVAASEDGEWRGFEVEWRRSTLAD